MYDIVSWLLSHLVAKILGPRGSKENPYVWSEWQLHSLPEASAILPIGPNAGIFHRQDFIIRTLHSKQKKEKGNMIDWHCFPAVLSYIVIKHGVGKYKQKEIWKGGCYSLAWNSPIFKVWYHRESKLLFESTVT